MSSTGFAAGCSGCLNFFLTEGLWASYYTPQKPHQTEETSLTFFHTASTLMQCFLLVGDAVWNETAWICHCCISRLFSSAQRQRW